MTTAQISITIENPDPADLATMMDGLRAFAGKVEGLGARRDPVPPEGTVSQ